MTQLFPGTRRDVREGLLRSHELLEKGGFIAAKTSGVWYLLPLGFRVHQKIVALIYRTLENIGAMNMTLPILQPSEDWKQSGRWQKYVDTKTIFQTTEHHSGGVYGFAPTAEEMATSLVAQFANSYRDLPLIVHQIGPKFRDELRPRFGLLRGREFTMSDAYSFDRDEEGMRLSYERMRQAYSEIFDVCGLRYIAVQADSGAIGGKGSAEFMALSENGEDVLLTCDQCDYGANQERAVSRIPQAVSGGESREKELIDTPNVATIEDLTKLLNIDATQTMKAVMMMADGEMVVAFIRGDLDVNAVKLQNHLKAVVLEAASDSAVEKAGLFAGSVGPVDLPSGVRVIFDTSLQGLTNVVSGANQHGKHFVNLNAGRDFGASEFADIANAQAGHTCVECGKGTLTVSRGIEVGHVFMLQTGYAETFNARYLDEHGKEQIMWMGTYGIGTTRLMQTVAEQLNDENGLVWPEAIAPYRVLVIPVNASDEVHARVSKEVYDALRAAGVEVLWDDRDLKAGEKFNDADLIGIPWQVICGREAANGKVEVKNRATGERITVSVDEALAKLTAR